jgi:hypothetical protein
MGCCPGSSLYATDEQKYGVAENTPCDMITVDLLNMYKNPIDCYVQYKLWANIGSSEAELLAAQSALNTLIAQKEADENNCEGIAALVMIRVIVDKIIKKGACL